MVDFRCVRACPPDLGCDGEVHILAVGLLAVTSLPDNDIVLIHLSAIAQTWLPEECGGRAGGSYDFLD